MTTPTFITTCLRNSPIARNVYEFAFAKPEGFAFQPGQFVLFSVPLVEDPLDVQPRALSIASSPDEQELLFVAKLKEGGRISRWITKTLTGGTVVTMQGPMGLFLLDRKTSKEYLLICTSTGIAPFRSMIRDALLRGNGRRIDLVFGARAEEDLFWMEELEELTKRYENFFLHLALSNPSDKWQGHRGRVQTLVPQIVQDFSQKCVYVCGSPDMTKEVKGLCLEQWGVKTDDLHVEGYI